MARDGVLHRVNRAISTVQIVTKPAAGKLRQALQVCQPKAHSGWEGNPGTGLKYTQILDCSQQTLQKAQAEFTWVCNRFTHL